MGSKLLCDGCGRDIQHEDRIQLSFGTLETGSVQCDLCMDCSEDIRATAIWSKLLADATAATQAENERRQRIMAEQQAEFEARAAVALEQQKEANAAMRAAGEV